MALTAALLKANALFASFTDEQVNAIVTLSTNDEQTQLDTKIGELHGKYDTDILAVSGVAKAQGEKSYAYAKRVLGEYKSKIAGLSGVEAQITTLKTEKADLEAKLLAGGDAATKTALQDAITKMSQLQGQYDADKAKFIEEKTALEGKVHLTKVESVLDNAIASLKFKATIPESVKSVLLKNAKSELFSTTKPEFTATGDLIFRDAAGAIMNNPANKLNPFTAQELISKSLVDVIDAGRKQPGGGSEPKPGSGPTTIDISAARTQIEADEIIQSHLLGAGVLKTDPSFGEQQSKLRTEHEVSKLPLR